MTRAVCSGSFDPVTLGHIDIFTRGAAIFDELIVCVFYNVRKKSFFTVDERVELLQEATKHLKNVKIDAFSGLVSDYMNKVEATAILRGIRNTEDLSYEEREARMIGYLDQKIDTLFLLTNPVYSYVSSSAVRELAAFGKLSHGIVPENVEEAIKRKLSQTKEKRD